MSETRYKERHQNIYDNEHDSDEANDEEKIYSYYINEDKEANNLDNAANFDMPDTSQHYSNYMVEQLHGWLSESVHVHVHVQLLPEIQRDDGSVYVRKFILGNIGSKQEIISCLLIEKPVCKNFVC